MDNFLRYHIRVSSRGVRVLMDSSGLFNLVLRKEDKNGGEACAIG